MPLLRAIALVLLFACLPLGTAPGEIAAGLACAVALFAGDRKQLPLLGPVLAVSLALGLSALGNGGAVEVAGKTWPLVAALALPMLTPRTPHLHRIEQVGLWAAAVAGVWALVATVSSGSPPWVSPALGPFSHHLTLGYALLAPLARALLVRAWVPAALIAVGVGCAGASGPLLSLAVVVVALGWRPLPALVAGVAVALAAMVLLRGDFELHQRAVLWATGAGLFTEHPAGVGPDGFRAAATALQARLEPGFYYPFHAHDSALQVAALAGAGAWVAWAWLLVETWRRSAIAGKAGIAALVVGALTQDTLGDLEVVRPLFAWALLPVLQATPVEPETGSDVGTKRVR